MATKTKKKSRKKAAKKASNIRTVAGRQVDTTPVDFETGSFDDFEFGGKTRKSSKYYALVQAALELEDRECISVGIGEDEDPDKKRMNIAQVVYNKVRPNRKGYKYKVRLTNDSSAIVIGCFSVEDEDDED